MHRSCCQATKIDGLALLPGRQPCPAVEPNAPGCNVRSRARLPDWKYRQLLNQTLPAPSHYTSIQACYQGFNQTLPWIGDMPGQAILQLITGSSHAGIELRQLIQGLNQKKAYYTKNILPIYMLLPVIQLCFLSWRNLIFNLFGHSCLAEYSIFCVRTTQILLVIEEELLWGPLKSSGKEQRRQFLWTLWTCAKRMILFHLMITMCVDFKRINSQAKSKLLFSFQNA